MRRHRRNRWNTNDLTTEPTNGIIQSSNGERRDMDIRDVANEISNITSAIEEAMSQAENTEGKIQERMDDLDRVKRELETGRESLDSVMSALQDFDGDLLANALDEASDLGVD